MKVLNAKNFKKGQKIIIVEPWNYLFNQTRRTHNLDEINAREWTIASIGKKILTLEDEEGTKGHIIRADGSGDFRAATNGRGYVGYAEKVSDVEEVVRALRDADPKKSEAFKIVNIRY
jgi:hypothetical protein